MRGAEQRPGPNGCAQLGRLPPCRSRTETFQCSNAGNVAECHRSGPAIHSRFVGVSPTRRRCACCSMMSLTSIATAIIGIATRVKANGNQSRCFVARIKSRGSVAACCRRRVKRQSDRKVRHAYELLGPVYGCLRVVYGRVRHARSEGGEVLLDELQ